MAHSIIAIQGEKCNKKLINFFVVIRQYFILNVEISVHYFSQCAFNMQYTQLEICIFIAL